MPVDIIRQRHPIALPGLPEDFIITQPALIETEVQTYHAMRSVVDTAMQGNIRAIHKPVMARGVHLNKLALPRTFIALFMLELFLCRPGPRRLDPSIRKHLADHMIRDNKTVTNWKLLAEGRKRSIWPELPIEPDDFCTKLVRVFLFLVRKTTMAIDESSLALFQIFVFEDKNGLSGKI